MSFYYSFLLMPGNQFIIICCSLGPPLQSKRNQIIFPKHTFTCNLSNKSWRWTCNLSTVLPLPFKASESSFIKRLQIEVKLKKKDHLYMAARVSEFEDWKCSPWGCGPCAEGDFELTRLTGGNEVVLLLFTLVTNGVFTWKFSSSLSITILGFKLYLARGLSYVALICSMSF